MNKDDTKGVGKILSIWDRFREKHPGKAEFFVFLMLSNGITVIQLMLMPILKSLLEQTNLVNIMFQLGQVGSNFDGSPYYIFNYPAGSLGSGGGGGLAYFLAVQITLAIAQVINFFAQRNITFKSTGNIWRAAGWYVIAYILITVGAAVLQGFYKAPIYELFINTWGMGKTGETLADIISMLIYCAVSFWVYYPILKIIFKQK
ncbi:GtrA family protein [Litchfieldia salsa]|nr:GtrA family protein [Litchfieldia salsa]